MVIAWFRLPPFIATLGMYHHHRGGRAPLHGFAELSRSIRTFSPGLVRDLTRRLHGHLRHDALGRADARSWATRSTKRLGACASTRSATRRRRRALNGVNVTRVVFSVYALAGVFYAFAAWQALGRTPIADPSGYQIANLDSITAVVIGGTSLFGGRGGVAGTFIGTLIVVALKNGLTQAGIDSLYQEIATGALVMLAVGADQYLGRGQRA